MSKLKVLTLTVVLLIICGQALAGPFARDVANSPEAQSEKGYNFYVSGNIPEAMHWYALAAEQGYAPAQYNLGLLYFHSDPPNYPAALELFEMAANQNYVDAQLLLGHIYLVGYGSSVDEVRAAKYYQLAVDQGHDLGAVSLAYMYYKGLGVEQSNAKAIELYEQAANNYFVQAYYNLAFIYTKPYVGEPDYAKAVPWLLKAAHADDAAAQNSLGHFYEQGLGVETNYDRAFEWFAKGAEQGNVYAMCGLAGMYEKGRGTKLDDFEARDLYAKAIVITEAEIAKIVELDNKSVAINIHGQEQILAFAQAYLGKMHEDGRGGDKDLLQAVKLYRAAVKNNGAQGQYNLARLYYLSQGVERDYVKAWALLQKALTNEDTYRYYFDFEKAPLLADIEKLLAELTSKMSDDAKIRGQKMLQSSTVEY